MKSCLKNEEKFTSNTHTNAKNKSWSKSDENIKKISSRITEFSHNKNSKHSNTTPESPKESLTKNSTKELNKMTER